MPSVVPEPKHEVAEVGVHEVPQLASVDMVVHSTVQNEVWEGLAGGHQSSFILGMREGPIPDIRILTGNGAHPAVLDSLIQLITKSHARLGKFLRGRSEISERWVQESRDKVEDPLGGDERLHAAIRKRTHQDNTPDEVHTVVGSDVSSNNTSHGPMDDEQSVKSRAMSVVPQTNHPARIGLLSPIPK